MLRKFFCWIFPYALIIVLSGLLWFLLSLFAENFNDIESKDDIIRFVKKNHDKLIECIQQRESEALEGYGIIKSVSESDDYIEFYCGGEGFASQTNYCGFFYAKNGNMNALCPNIEINDMVAKDGGYYWQEEVGDNTYFVAHICDKFYYYFMHF